METYINQDMMQCGYNDRGEILWEKPNFGGVGLKREGWYCCLICGFSSYIEQLVKEHNC